MNTPSENIILRRTSHRDKQVILLEFYKRQDWLRTIKTLPKIRFSKTLGFWYIPYDKQAYNQFVRLQLPYTLFSPQVVANATTEVPASELDTSDIAPTDRSATVHPASGSMGTDIQENRKIKVSWNARKLIISVPYSHVDVQYLKKLERCWWHPNEKVWICKDTLKNLELIQSRWYPWSNDQYQHLFDLISKTRTPCKLKLYYTPEFDSKVCAMIVGYGSNHEIIKSVSGREYHKELKLYTIPADQKVVDMVIERYQSLGYTIENRLAVYPTKSKLNTNAKKLERFLEKLNTDQYSCVKTMSDRMLSQGYGIKTITSYCGRVLKMMDYLKQNDLSNVSAEQVQSYLDMLAKQGVSFSLINQLHSAVNYYFQRVDPTTDFSLAKLKRPRKQKQLPKFLSEGEVIRLIEQIENLKHLAIVYILYGSGVRRGELISIKISNIYWERNQIMIFNGKGGKDRMVNLSYEAKVILERYFHRYSPQTFLFEGAKAGTPYSPTSVSRIITSAAKKAQISKKVTPHMLRHSFATHLMDRGIALPKIQKLLGHKNVKTTMIYTHVTTDQISEVLSPLDMIKKNHK